MNCLADALVSAASAKVTPHGLIDLHVGWTRGASQQSECGHDLARLAIPALRDGLFQPSLLKRMQLPVGRRQTFYCRNFTAYGRANGELATAYRLSVDQHCAGAADPLAAAELCTDQAQSFPKDSEQRIFPPCCGNGKGLFIDVELQGDISSVAERFQG